MGEFKKYYKYCSECLFYQSVSGYTAKQCVQEANVIRAISNKEWKKRGDAIGFYRKAKEINHDNICHWFRWSPGILGDIVKM